MCRDLLKLRVCQLGRVEDPGDGIGGRVAVSLNDNILPPDVFGFSASCAIQKLLGDLFILNDASFDQAAPDLPRAFQVSATEGIPAPAGVGGYINRSRNFWHVVARLSLYVSGYNSPEFILHACI
jgi:hypothetical protein